MAYSFGCLMKIPHIAFPSLKSGHCLFHWTHSCWFLMDYTTCTSYTKTIHAYLLSVACLCGARGGSHLIRVIVRVQVAPVHFYPPLGNMSRFGQPGIYTQNMPTSSIDLHTPTYLQVWGNKCLLCCCGCEKLLPRGPLFLLNRFRLVTCSWAKFFWIGCSHHTMFME